jgi:small subunit ribosomal protein S3
MADRVVKEGITHVLTKMGIMGIRLKIAIKGAVPPEFELISSFKENAMDMTQENPNTIQNQEAYGTDENIEKVEVKEEVKP